jgi:hypothetical protein
LDELGFHQAEPTVIYQDNANVINLSDLSAKDNMTKYLINKINFVREAIDDQIIVLRYVGSLDNVADIGTKSLEPAHHQKLTNILMNGFH